MEIGKCRKIRGLGKLVGFKEKVKNSFSGGVLEQY
jgi:hypothetical protein